MLLENLNHFKCVTAHSFFVAPADQNYLLTRPGERNHVFGRTTYSIFQAGAFPAEVPRTFGS